MWPAASLLIANPITTVALLVALAWAVRSLVVTSAIDASAAGRYVRRQLHRGPGEFHRPTIIGYGDELYFVREPTGLRIVDPDITSWDEPSRLLRERPQEVLLMHYLAMRLRQGTWGLTEDARAYRLAESLGSSFTPEERQEARRIYLERLAARGQIDSARAERLKVADFSEDHLLWRGYAFNIACLAGAIALLYSLRWIPRTPAWFRARHRTQALRRGRCPRCGYTISGLPEPRCPECGETWEDEASDH